MVGAAAGFDETLWNLTAMGTYDVADSGFRICASGLDPNF